MKHIGLFEGIGGFSLAARWAGWETVVWCEWDEFCQKVLKHHFPEAEHYGDITTTDFTRYAGQIDILTGGFPCQPYSSAGKRLGKEDDRHLWPEMLRAIREIQPTWVVGENVRGLTNWNGGMVFDEVQADMEAEGYEVLPFLLPACAVNAPHRRDRIWFIAVKNTLQDGCVQRESCEKRTGVREQRNTCTGSSNGVCLSERATANLYQTRLQRGKEFGSIGGGWANSDKQFAGFVRTTWDFFPTQSPICSRNDGISNQLDGITFSKWREKSIGAYGNAIVPQVAYQIFKAINQYNKISEL
jgi:DNA (cytosine-5)-methyltransferase 1